MLDAPLHKVTGTVRDGVLVATIMVKQLRDAEPAYALRDEITALIDSSRASDLVLDMRHVEFIGSVGLLAFLGVRRHVSKSRIVLCELAAPIEKMFAVCRLIPTDIAPNAAFEMELTLESALARCKTTSASPQ